MRLTSLVLVGFLALFSGCKSGYDPVGRVIHRPGQLYPDIRLAEYDVIYELYQLNGVDSPAFLVKRIGVPKGAKVGFVRGENGEFKASAAGKEIPLAKGGTSGKSLQRVNAAD